MKYKVTPSPGKIQINLTDTEHDIELYLTPRQAFEFARDIKKQAKVAKKLK